MNENTKTSMENAIGEIKVSQKADFPNKIYTKADGLFSIFCMLMGFLFVRFFLFDFWYTQFDTNLIIYSLMYVAGVAVYTKAKGKRLNRESLFWLGVLAVVVALFKIENFFRLVLAVCVAAYFTAVTGGLYGGGTSAYMPADLCAVYLTLPFVNFFSIVPAFFSLFKKRKSGEKKRISPAVWGVVLAAVALWFIMPLLFAADSNFLKGAKDMVEYLTGMLFGGFDLFTILVHLIFATPVACYIFGLCYGSLSTPQYGKLDKDIIDRDRRRLRISTALTLKVFMYIVCFVYVLFIALQAEYLLGAFAGKLYGSMTYAEYARTGFFELCKVSVINLSLLAICNLLIKNDEQPGIRIPMVILCVLSLLLLSTATAKMAMYISVYGLTVKRVVSTVFLLWLVAVFAMCIARLYKPYNLVKAAVITGAVMFCVLFSFDIGLHCDNFNSANGFDEKQQPEAVYTDTIILPDKMSVLGFSVHHSKDTTYSFSISNTFANLDKMYNILENAQLTDIPSIQDFPDRDEYYTITVHSNDPTITIYCYEKNGTVYLEKPYSGVWITDTDLPQMFRDRNF